MIKRIKINLEAIEAMIYYWQSTKDKEKVGEAYIHTISEMKPMKYLYDDEFKQESVRRALSAISNREIFTAKNKKEGRFWNANM